MVVPGRQTTNPKYKFRPMCQSLLYVIDHPNARPDNIYVMPFNTLFRVVRARLAHGLEYTNDRRDMEIVPLMDEALLSLHPGIPTNHQVFYFSYDRLLEALSNMAQKKPGYEGEDKRIARLYTQTFYDLLNTE